MYGYGHGVPQDKLMAVKLYQEAVDTGNYLTAQFNLGYMYDHGYGLVVDKKKNGSKVLSISSR